MDSNKSQNIISKLKEINENLTEEKINTATKEELVQYLKQVDEFKALLLTVAEDE